MSTQVNKYMVSEISAMTKMKRRGSGGMRVQGRLDSDVRWG